MPEDTTSTEQFSAPTPSESSSTKSRKPSKRLVAILIAGVLVLAGGITVTSVTVANAAAEETARQCAVALKSDTAAAKTAATSLESADAALEAVKSLALPGDQGWTSTDYAARPGAAAIEAVAAVEAAEGVEAVTGVDAVAERPSGADLITRVSDDRASLAEIKIPTECIERDDAAKVTSVTKAAKTATMQLDAGVTILLADFTVFQTEESARIAAEIEAARIAAEIEAARVAAEAEAARVAAAAAEAARQAAAARPSPPRGSTGGGAAAPPKSSGGGGGGAVTPPRGGGGGQVGPGNGGVQLCDNGFGGVKAC